MGATSLQLGGVDNIHAFMKKNSQLRVFLCSSNQKNVHIAYLY